MKQSIKQSSIKPVKVLEHIQTVTIPTAPTMPSMFNNMSSFQMGEVVKLLVSNFGTVLLIVAAFLIGMLWTEVRYLKQGGVGGGAKTPTTPTAAQAQPAQTQLSIDQVKALFVKGRIMFGDASKKVLFVEVSDPSCPFCHIASGLNPELNKQSGGQFLMKADGGTYVPPVPEMRKLVESGKAAFLWMYSPGHGSGEMGTKALYCAFEKGKFWQVHDLIMTNAGYNLMNNVVKNDKAQVDALAEFLKSAMNPKDLKDCIASGTYDAKPAEDTQAAAKIGYQGTPYFLINTKPFAGAYSYEQMQADVTAALK